MNRSDSGAYARRVLVTVGLAVLLLGLVWLLARVASVLLLVFVGLLLAVFLRTLANFVSRYTRLSPGWALPLVIVTLLALLGVSGWLLFPGVARQVDQLVREVPRALGQLEQQLQQYGWGRWLLARAPAEGVSAPSGRAFLSQVTGTVASIWNVLAGIVFVVIIGIFVAADPNVYRTGLLRLIPPTRRRRGGEVLDELWATLQAWLFGQFISMALIAVLTMLGLWVLGVPLALTLGLLAGALEFIPTVGPFIAALPAVLLAFVEGPTRALYVGVLYVVIQQVEENVVMPLVHERTVSLPPALTLVALLVMGSLFGFLGLLVATPLTAVVLVLMKMLYLEDVLGESVELPGE